MADPVSAVGGGQNCATRSSNHESTVAVSDTVKIGARGAAIRRPNRSIGGGEGDAAASQSHENAVTVRQPPQGFRAGTEIMLRPCYAIRRGQSFRW